MIELHYIDVEVPGMSPELLVLWLNDCVLSEEKKPGVVNLICCNDEYLFNINKEFLKHSYYTDIITFDYCENDVVGGDLYISIDRVKENAESLKEPFNTEFRRVCIHGVLHLCGFSDKSHQQKKAMRDKENYYLEKYVSRGT